MCACYSSLRVRARVDSACLHRAQRGVTSCRGSSEVQSVTVPALTAWTGIMEMADVVVINKADGDLLPVAERAAAQAASGLAFIRPRWRGWRAEVLLCSALKNKGIDSVWDRLVSFQAVVTESGELRARRGEQRVHWMWENIRDQFFKMLAADATVVQAAAVILSMLLSLLTLQIQEQSLHDGHTTPILAARCVLKQWQQDARRA